jgi:hypothetical protein
MTFTAAKQGFFDRAAVRSAVDAATRRVFSKFGAFVRQRARTSIRRRKGSSRPGSPPHSHVGLLKRFIFFAFDPARKSVVVGPTLIRSESEAPRLLEHGGEFVDEDDGEPRLRRYAARPFMGPAFEMELASLPDLWRDSVR